MIFKDIAEHNIKDSSIIGYCLNLSKTSYSTIEGLIIFTNHSKIILSYGKGKNGKEFLNNDIEKLKLLIE